MDGKDLRKLIVTSLCLLPAMLAPAPCGATMGSADDTFFLVDVSGSMSGKGGAEGYENIFPEIKERLIEDIRSRHTSDHVALYLFGDGDPRLVDSREIQSDTDKDVLIEQIRGLEANDNWTYLYSSILEILEEAEEWATSHRDHNVDVRVYTDGVNTGPEVLDEVLDRLRKLKAGDAPHLQMYVLRYTHPGETEENRRKIEDEIAKLREVGVPTLPPSARFVRVKHGRTELANLRSSGFNAPMTLLFYYGGDLEGELVQVAENVAAKSSTGFPLLFDFLPRVVNLSDDAVEGQLRLTNWRELPDDASIEFTGSIGFSAPNSTSPVIFQPSSVSFSGRIAPVRTLSITIVPDTELIAPRSAGQLLWASLTDESVIFSDTGLPEVRTFRLVVDDSTDLLPEDEVTLTARLVGAARIEGQVAWFSTGGQEADDGRPTRVTVDSKTDDLFLRASYPPELLEHVNEPTYAPVEITWASDDPDVLVSFSIPGAELFDIEPTETARAEGDEDAVAAPDLGSGTGSGAAELPATSRVLLFPAAAPPIEVVVGTPPGEWQPAEHGGGFIKPPPAWWVQVLVAVAQALMIALALHLLAFVPKGWSIVTFAIFTVLGTWAAGWSGWLMTPHSGTEQLAWAAGAALAIVFVLSPSCFALTPWGIRGWKLQGATPASLVKATRSKRRRAWFPAPFAHTMEVRVGGRSAGNDLVHIDLTGRQFTLRAPGLGKRVKLRASNDEVAVNGDAVGFGRTKRVRSGDNIATSGVMFTLRRN